MGCLIRFLPSNRSILVPEGTLLLEAARQAGLPVAQSCGGDGVCGKCGMQVLESAPALLPETDLERDAKRANSIDPKLRLSCLVLLEGNLTVSAPYW